MVNIAIHRILYKGNLSISCSFLIAVLVMGPTLGMISITNDVMGQPFKELKYDDHLFRVSDSVTHAIPPNGECPEGTTQASPPLNPQLGCNPNNETSEPNSNSNFIIQVTVVDDLNDNHNFYDLVDIYVKEYPQYGHFNIDLTDALYSDTSDGEYTTEIIMPSGLIEVDEEFQICIEGPVSGGDNGIICEDLTNSPQQQPEEITITA